MLKFAANLNSLWGELPYLDRFDAAAAAGFEAVAVPLPYEAPAKDTQRACLRANLPVVQISAPPPNYTGGTRGFAAVPGLEDRFRYDLRRALRYCTALKVPMLHIMAGAAKGADARSTLLENLRHAVDVIPDGITLTLQPQAQEDAYLCDYTRAIDILEALGSAKVGLQYHSYHAQAVHGCAIEAFEAYASMIRHIQIGDSPGAGAPGTGQIDFAALFAAIETGGYDGWIVADYTGTGATGDSLGWLPVSAD